MWQFETEPEYQSNQAWMIECVREEIERLDSLSPYDDTYNLQKEHWMHFMALLK